MKTIKINKLTDNIEYFKRNKRTIIDCSVDNSLSQSLITGDLTDCKKKNISQFANTEGSNLHNETLDSLANISTMEQSADVYEGQSSDTKSRSLEQSKSLNALESKNT